MRRRGESELELLPYLVDPARNAVDVGANKGTYSFELARLCPRVDSYEPNPAMRFFLTRLAPANVVVHDAAVSDRAGTADLGVPIRGQRHSNNIGTLDVGALEGEFTTVSVRTVRLGDEALENVGFIKIDVEGLEDQVLAGAEPLLARDRPVLLVEMLDAFAGEGPPPAMARLQALDYAVMAVVEGRLVTWSALARKLGPAKGDDGAGQVPRNFIFFPR